jgi:hypothetical protein
VTPEQTPRGGHPTVGELIPVRALISSADVLPFVGLALLVALLSIVVVSGR